MKINMKTVFSYARIVLGVIITAAAISLFYLPNKIVSGGVSGMSTILYHVFSVPAGLSYAVINLLLLLIALKVIGWRFVSKTILGAALISLFVELFSYLPPATDDVFLATVFGSLLYGVGIGITLVEGASTGGTDILGRLIQHKFPHISIGRLLLIVDAAVILTSLVVFKEVNLTLYGVIALAVSTIAIDTLIKKLNISKLAFVITDKGEEIAHLLVSTSPRGVTLFKAVGAYTGDARDMLMCALKEREIPAFQKKITDSDPHAFIIFSESQQIVGNGFIVYR